MAKRSKPAPGGGTAAARWSILVGRRVPETELWPGFAPGTVYVVSAEMLAKLGDAVAERTPLAEPPPPAIG